MIWSHSTRSAWIEMFKALIEYYETIVALHTECVD